MPLYSCKNCRGSFSAREADRRRGWARFCSKSCKAIAQEKRTGQNARYLERRSDSYSDEILSSVTTSHGQWEGA